MAERGHRWAGHLGGTSTAGSAYGPFGPSVSVEFNARFVPPPTPGRAAAVARGRKMRALAERPGTPAEGDAARRALAALLASAGLTARDLDDDGGGPVTVTVRRGPRAGGQGARAAAR